MKHAPVDLESPSRSFPHCSLLEGMVLCFVCLAPGPGTMIFWWNAFIHNSTESWNCYTEDFWNRYIVCLEKDGEAIAFFFLIAVKSGNVYYFLLPTVNKQKLGLFDCQELSVAFMDAKNGFLTKFYIEIVIRFFSQLLFFIGKKSFWK